MMSLSEIERLVGAEGHELLRELMQAHVDLRAAKERVVEVTGADGVPRTQVRQGTRTVETPHGEIAVTRKLYQAAGVDGLAPLDAALGLPDEHYSLEDRRLVAEESARASFDQVVELISKRTGAHVPKRQVEELTVRAAQDFDAFYDSRLREPEATGDLLVLSFDGKGIAMRHAARARRTARLFDRDRERRLASSRPTSQSMDSGRPTGADRLVIGGTPY